MSVRVVFLGAKPVGFHCFKHLLEQRPELNIEVLALGTRLRPEFDTRFDLAQLAATHDIPLLDSLDKLPECDIIYSVQHHEILKERHIRRAQQISVNLHLAPLPEYRGCNQFSFAIWDQAKVFGVSIHEIDAQIDHGDVLFEQRFPIPEECWVSDLYDRSVAEACSLFEASLPDIISGNYKKVSQNELMQSRPSSIHYRSEIAALKQVDLNEGEEQIARRIRATTMPGFEPPYCYIGGKKVYFEIAVSGS